MTQATYILRNITESAITSVVAMEPRDALAKLERWAHGDLRHCVSVKYGRGTFGDRVTWNGIVKSGGTLGFKIEPRRGYKLVTFTPA